LDKVTVRTGGSHYTVFNPGFPRLGADLVHFSHALLSEKKANLLLEYLQHNSSQAKSSKNKLI
jgi:hypothetical protein